MLLKRATLLKRTDPHSKRIQASGIRTDEWKWTEDATPTQQERIRMANDCDDNVLREELCMSSVLNVPGREGDVSR
jgi:hypothetical protein